MAAHSPNRKAIKQEVINEVSKQYKTRYEDSIKSLQDTLKRLNNENTQLRNENHILKHQNIVISDELEKYKDWNRRLQEFVNLPDNERQSAIDEFVIDMEGKKALNAFFKKFNPYFDAIFR